MEAAARCDAVVSAVRNFGKSRHSSGVKTRPFVDVPPAFRQGGGAGGDRGGGGGSRDDDQLRAEATAAGSRQRRRRRSTAAREPALGTEGHAGVGGAARVDARGDPIRLGVADDRLLAGESVLRERHDPVVDGDVEDLPLSVVCPRTCVRSAIRRELRRIIASRISTPSCAAHLFCVPSTLVNVTAWLAMKSSSVAGAVVSADVRSRSP